MAIDMAIKIRGIDPTNKITEFISDTEAEVQQLPTQTEPTEAFGTVVTGSTCLVIGDGSGAKLYMLNSEGKWNAL